MEAPIPASALIHSATLVSAGVYLLLKFNWLLLATNVSFFIIILGAITALYGAFVSAAQTDCKKLLAYSTISHCGFLFITIGLNNIYLTITYLYLHGFFKALTFFCLGNLVKVSKGYQDSRKMGQLFSILPIESILFLICSVNLGALPFTVGYFYKLLFQTIAINLYLTCIILFFVLVAMLCSIIYVFRLVFYTLFDIQKNNNNVFDSYFNTKFNDEEYSNTSSLSILFIYSLLILAIYIYFFYFLFYKNFLNFDITLNSDVSIISDYLKKNTINFYIFFYIFFGVIVLVLLKVTCRDEFSDLKKKYFIHRFALFIVFLQFSIMFLSVVHI